MVLHLDVQRRKNYYFSHFHCVNEVQTLGELRMHRAAKWMG